jgi:hypothetical protein
METEAQTSSVDLSTRDLAARITELAGHLNAANHRWLMLIAEFDRRNGWSDGGTQSCAHWLNWKCGLDMGAAREKVRVAHALQSLPKISAAMERGEISYSKVRAMTRVATEATEDYLLMIARHGTAMHVEETVRHFRNALDAEERAKEARQQKQRSLTYSYDNDENGTPLDIGRKTRTIPPSIRRALNSRDKGCRFPGCCNKKFVDGHHIKHWANGGETKLSNLVSLCRFHHRLVHEGGVEVHVLNDGAIRFVKPNGQPFDSIVPGFTQPLSEWTQIPVSNERAHLHIDERTAATKWGGESMDYGLAVQVLLQQQSRVGA